MCCNADFCARRHVSSRMLLVHIIGPSKPFTMHCTCIHFSSNISGNDGWRQHLRTQAWHSLGALPHLTALLLQTASALLLPLPSKHRPRLLVRIGFVRHGAPM